MGWRWFLGKCSNSLYFSQFSRVRGHRFGGFLAESLHQLSLCEGYRFPSCRRPFGLWKNWGVLRGCCVLGVGIWFAETPVNMSERSDVSMFRTFWSFSSLLLVIFFVKALTILVNSSICLSISENLFFLNFSLSSSEDRIVSNLFAWK